VSTHRLVLTWRPRASPAREEWRRAQRSTETKPSPAAASRAGADDDTGRANLFRYVLRPPIAQEHVTMTENGLVAIKLKRPFRDGTTSVEMDPLSLLSRLAASVHPPRFHSIRYGGVLAPHSKWRPHIVPPPPPADAAASGCHSLPPGRDTPARPPTHRCRYRPWHELMRRCLKIDVETCGQCGGKMRLVALVKESHNIARYLRHLGLPTDVPSLFPARGPPFWQSTVLRRRYGMPPDADEA
jgi:hypothetical protein